MMQFIEKDGRDFTFLEVIHICEAERVVWRNHNHEFITWSERNWH